MRSARLLVVALVGLGIFAMTSMRGAQAQRTGETPIGILLAAGDIAHCNGEDQPGYIATGDLIASQLEAAKSQHIPVAVLALGDLAYPRGREQDFDCFHAGWSARFGKDILPVPGNHDYQRPSYGRPYYEHFRKYGNDTVAGNTTGYYSLVFPAGHPNGWLLLALNSMLEVKRWAWPWESEQVGWLRKQLANEENGTRCVLAFWHHFVFSSGLLGHNESPDPNARLVPGFMLPAFKLLYDHGSTVALTGHDHSFEQFARQDARGVRKDDGVRTFVVGTGGAGLYNSTMNRKTKVVSRLAYKTTAANSERYANRSFGVLKIELFADRYTWDFLAVPGSTPVDLAGMNSDTCNHRRKP